MAVLKPKLLKWSEEARKDIKAGLDILANAVKATLGPRGRNVIYANTYLPPQVTKDGVTVARQIELEDPFQRIGAEIGKHAAGKTVDTAGDGTTTAVVLTQALYTEGIKVLSGGVNPILLKKGIEKAVEAVLVHLKAMAKKVSKDKDAILSVAKIAANNDEVISNLIYQAIEKVGEDGVITIEDSPNSDTFIETVEGMQLNEGLLHPYFINYPKLMMAKHKDARILLCSREIRDPGEIAPIFEKCIEKSVPLVIIADGVVAGALATLVTNFINSKGNFRCMAVRAPGYGDRRKQFLEDIAIYTGTKVVSDDTGVDIKKLEIEDLGKCKNIEATKDSCTILKGGGDPGNIQARVEEIKAEIESSQSDYDKEKLQERLAKLTTGVAVLKIGAPTETEMIEKKMRVEDALHATKAAIEEGIVPGGGIALYRCSQLIKKPEDLTIEESMGFDLLASILPIPLKTIVHNAGLDGSEVIAAIKNKKVSYGMDVLNTKYGDMMKMGVVDPLKVVRLTLENSASVAGLALTTEVCIVDKPEETKDPSYGPGR